jgi:hypothetical protein
MTKRLRVRWFNSNDCEIAQVTCSDERDAATQLARMVVDAGNEVIAGDYFKVEDVEEEFK